MGNVVAARRLRKSMLRELNGSQVNPLTSLKDIGMYAREENRIKTYEDYLEADQINTEEKKEKKFNYKTKLLIRVFIASVIVFLCLIGKLLMKDILLNQKYIQKIIYEYQKDYSREYILEKSENFIRIIYPNIKFMIPETISNQIKEKYYAYKSNIIEFSLKEYIYQIMYKDQSVATMSKEVDTEVIKEEEIKRIVTEVGEAKPIEIHTESSAVSMMQDDVATVLSKNINICLPVHGTITSEYGARDQVFEGINSYHTGIDIANSMGTEIKSATDGIVHKTQEMNKYYGNNIEIECNGVIFKYAHLSQINVKEGDTVKQGDIIGLMGSTGMSTGSHLHFEVIVNSRTLDPRKLLNF